VIRHRARAATRACVRPRRPTILVAIRGAAFVADSALLSESFTASSGERRPFETQNPNPPGGVARCGHQRGCDTGTIDLTEKHASCGGGENTADICESLVDRYWVPRMGAACERVTFSGSVHKARIVGEAETVFEVLQPSPMGSPLRSAL